MYHSSRNIALLKYIVITIQTKDVIEKRMEPIDVPFIEKTIGRDMETLRKLLADPDDPEDAQYHEYITKLYARQAKEVATENDEEKGRLFDMMAAGELTRKREASAAELSSQSATLQIILKRRLTAQSDRQSIRNRISWITLRSFLHRRL